MDPIILTLGGVHYSRPRAGEQLPLSITLSIKYGLLRKWNMWCTLKLIKMSIFMTLFLLDSKFHKKIFSITPSFESRYAMRDDTNKFHFRVFLFFCLFLFVFFFVFLKEKIWTIKKENWCKMVIHYYDFFCTILLDAWPHFPFLFRSWYFTHNMLDLITNKA